MFDGSNHGAVKGECVPSEIVSCGKISNHQKAVYVSRPPHSSARCSNGEEFPAINPVERRERCGQAELSMLTIQRKRSGYRVTSQAIEQSSNRGLGCMSLHTPRTLVTSSLLADS